MKPTRETMLKLEELSEKLGRVSGHFSEKEYEPALKLVAEVLGRVSLSDEDRSHFLWFKGACLDNMDRSMDAIQIFLDLKTRFPFDPKFNRSVYVCATAISNKARQIFNCEPESPLLEKYYNVLRETHYVPWWLTSAMSRIWSKGDATARARAKSVVKAMLELSPNDSDYLGAAISTAVAIDDTKWRTELLGHVRSLLAEQPYRTDLWRLMPPEAEPESHAAGAA